MAASDPPTPGRISSKHGRCANGWTGTREVTRLCEAVASCVRVSARSSAARDRSSASVVDSCISDVSSVTDLVQISYRVAPAGLAMRYAHLVGLVPRFQCIHNWGILAQFLRCLRIEAVGERICQLLVFRGDGASACDESRRYRLGGCSLCPLLATHLKMRRIYCTTHQLSGSGHGVSTEA